MAKAQDSIDIARSFLEDQDSIRWNDAELIVWLNDGVKMIRSRRPDAQFADDDGDYVEYADISTINPDAELCIPDRFAAPLGDFIAMKAFSMDAADINDAERAKLHMRNFYETLSSI